MSSLRYAIYGGEAMSVENERAINNILRSCHSRGLLCKGLGATEMTAAATSTYDDCNIEGSAGIPLVWTNCKIVDPETYEEKTYGKIGEICFSGPTLILGYYNKPEATDAVIKMHKDKERWLHTGDMGYVDEDGILFVTGRIKRIIMTRGNDGNITKIFPDRIESVISKCSVVSVCCVIGVPDEVRINYPIAYVVLKVDDAKDTAVKEIMSVCREQLPEYMVPEKIEFRTDLPRTPRGKVDYRALESEHL